VRENRAGEEAEEREREKEGKREREREDLYVERWGESVRGKGKERELVARTTANLRFRNGNV
jgi:hypothetical protein